MSDKNITTDFSEFSELMTDSKVEEGVAQPAVAKSVAQPVEAPKPTEEVPATQGANPLRDKAVALISEKHPNADSKTIVELFYKAVEFYEPSKGRLSEEDYANFVIGFINSQVIKLGANYKVNLLVLGAMRQYNRNAGNYTVALYGFMRKDDEPNKWAYTKLIKTYTELSSTSYIDTIQPRTMYNMYAAFNGEFSRSFTVDSSDPSNSNLKMVIGKLTDMVNFSSGYEVETGDIFETMSLPVFAKTFMRIPYKKRVEGPTGCGESRKTKEGYTDREDLKIIILKPTEEPRFIENTGRMIINATSFEDPFEEFEIWCHNSVHWNDYDYIRDALVVLGSVRKGNQKYSVDNLIDIETVDITDVRNFFP